MAYPFSASFLVESAAWCGLEICGIGFILDSVPYYKGKNRGFKLGSASQMSWSWGVRAELADTGPLARAP